MVERDVAVADYSELRPKFERLSSRIEILLRDLTNSLKVHVVSSRTKEPDSFRKKSLRRSKDGKYLYSNPIDEIEDLSAVRIICFSNSQVEEVCQIVKSNFKVHETIDKAKELSRAGKVGYVSQHFIVSVDNDRVKLPEYSGFKDMKAEIQVRTVFQHAWAEVEHRLQYKDDSPKPELRSRFQALAGLVQIADREFDELFALDAQLSEEISKTLSEIVVDDQISSETGSEQSTHKLSVASTIFGAPPKELVARGEYEKAIATYNELIALQPKQSWHYIGRAKARIAAGDFFGASEDVQSIKRAKSQDQRIIAAIDFLNRALGEKPS